MSNTNSWIKLWKDRNYKDDYTDKLYGNDDYDLHEENRMKDEASSLKTGSQTWVKLYDKKDFGDGNTQWIGPNMHIPNLDGLMMTHNSDGGQTWLNRIGSVKVRDTPPNTDIDFDCWIKLYKNTDFDEEGRTLFLNGPLEVENLHDYNYMKDETSSLKTGPKTWVILFNKKDLDYGSQLIVGPNTEISDLNTYSQNSENGTWDNSIGSLQMYNTPLVDLNAVVSNFWNLYGLNGVSLSQPLKGQSATIGAGSGTYQLKTPNFSFLEDGNYEVSMETRHSCVDQQDDKATIKFTISPTGHVTKDITISYDYSSGVPDWLITLIDKTISTTETVLKIVEDGVEVVILDAAAAITAPISNALTTSVADCMIFAVDHVNTVLAFIGKLIENGSTGTFPLVNTQVTARLVRSFQQEVAGEGYDSEEIFQTPDQRPTLNNDAFATAMNADWNDSGSHDFIMFDDGGRSYRIWNPERTAHFSAPFIILTAQIDQKNDNEKDAHLYLTAAYDGTGNCIAGHANVMMLALDDTLGNDNGASTGVVTYGPDDKGSTKLINITTDDSGNRSISDITGTTNLIDAVKNNLNAALSDAAKHNDLQVGTKNFDNVSKRVLSAWGASISMHNVST